MWPKETYMLSWVPSVDARAAQQNIFAIIGGAPAIALNASVFDNTVTSLQYDFDMDANVEWYVQTLNADGSLTVESVHATFVATNQTPPSPLTPATGLKEAWVMHIS